MPIILLKGQLFFMDFFGAVGRVVVAGGGVSIFAGRNSVVGVGNAGFFGVVATTGLLFG